MYQDSKFIFDAINGLKTESIILCKKEETDEPIIIYIKVENRNWHQYFLDVGIGFLESWDEIDDFEDDKDYKYVEVFKEFDLKDKLISKIFCVPDFNNSRIVIEFDNEKSIILKCINPEICDSECEFIFE